MEIVFTMTALSEYKFWMKNDPKRAERIRKLCEDIRLNPFKGIGKPEPLRFNLQGQWSRRIDREHRLVYSVEKNRIVIHTCRFHY